MGRRVRVLLLVGALALVPAACHAHGHRAPLSFVLTDVRGFEVDTRAGTVTADMVHRPDTTIALRLTAAELAALAKEFRASHLLAVPEPFPPYPDPPDHHILSQAPSTRWVLDLTLDGRHRHWSWGTQRIPDPSTDDWAALNGAVLRICSVVRQRLECRALPEPTGRYQ